MGSMEWLHIPASSVWERRAQVTSFFVSKQPSMLSIKELNNTAVLCLFTTAAQSLLSQVLFSHETAVLGNAHSKS